MALRKIKMQVHIFFLENLQPGLVVEALELRERGLEELLRFALVRDDALEVLVLELAVLPRALELHLAREKLGRSGKKPLDKPFTDKLCIN